MGGGRAYANRWRGGGLLSTAVQYLLGLHIRGVCRAAVAAVAGQEQMPGGATYGASGDFNKFSPNQIRWIDATELQKRLTESTVEKTFESNARLVRSCHASMHLATLYSDFIHYRRK